MTWRSASLTMPETGVVWRADLLAGYLLAALPIESGSEGALSQGRARCGLGGV